MILTIDPEATATAGPDDVMCAGFTYTLAGARGGSATTSTWTTSGTGTFVLDTDPTTDYNPSAADILAGTVTLTITTDDPAGPCPAIVDAMILTISTNATTSAGANDVICSGSTYTLSGTMGSGATGVTWTTAGTGTYDNVALLAATYTPSAADILAGSVVLTITTNDPDGAGPCLAATDDMTLTINPIAIASANVDDVICAGSNYTMAGSFGGGTSSITWTTSGTGVFTLATDPTTVYTPSAADSLAGTVTLTITTDDPDGAGPCLNTSDAMILTLDVPAVVNAGADDVICSGSTYSLTGTMSGSSGAVTWSTTGTGVFDNNTLLTPVYTPSAADNTAGSVTLAITSDDPAGPCAPVADSMLLTINQLDIV
jgi:hypothetical protein